MDYRQLGRSGLRVSALTLGTMTFGGGGRFALVGSTDLEAARRQVDMAIDAGVNMIDTADVYSDGLSEEILGQVLEGRRDDVLVATKARMPMGDGPNDAGLSRHHLIGACEASLRRLRTDRIDLYQVHEWDGQTPLEETLQALDDLVHAGKVRYVGCSNYAGWQLMKALGIAERRGLTRFASQQIHYTLQAREAEYELVPIAVDQGLGLLVWSPLAGGLLAGAVEKAAGGRRGDERTQERLERHRPTLERYEAFCRDIGHAPADVGVAWLLHQPAVTAPIVGPRTMEQFEQSLRALEVELDDKALERLDQIWPGPGGPAPEAYAW
jgi:aryl-alcohol dehydrogenase-like predicted oxidoreductase